MGMYESKAKRLSWRVEQEDFTGKIVLILVEDGEDTVKVRMSEGDARQLARDILRA
jgi:hypothetical protein